jgi:hypothetical protein
MASRNTTKANQKESWKIFDPGPSTRAKDVAMEHTRAAWLEGMPPVRQTRVSKVSRKFLFREPIRWMIIFKNWAIQKLVIEERNT